MKNKIEFAALVVMTMIIAACGNGIMNQKDLDIIQRYVDAVETNNVEEMASILHDDYRGYGPSVGDSTNKADAIANWKYLSETLYDKIEYEDMQNLAVAIKDGPRKGDWVSNWSLLHISYKDGRGPVDLYVNVVYRIEDGKIIHSRTFYNEADVLRQLGYTYN